MQIIPVRVGVGGVYAAADITHYGSLSVGGGVSRMWRLSGTTPGGREVRVGIPLSQVAATCVPPAVLMGDLPGDTCPLALLGLTYTDNLSIDNRDPIISYLGIRPFHDSPPPHWTDRFDIRVTAAAGLALDAGFSPGQFLDFLGGWFGVDLARDDRQRGREPSDVQVTE